jgi:hypothetical protein
MKSPGDGAPDALGTEQTHDFANAIDWPPVPGGHNIADEHSGARGRSIRIKAHGGTSRCARISGRTDRKSDHLCEGQEATVLQLPAQPATAAEADAQKRVAHVG